MAALKSERGTRPLRARVPLKSRVIRYRRERPRQRAAGTPLDARRVQEFRAGNPHLAVLARYRTSLRAVEVFVLNVDEASRIRTGERGEEAI